MGKSMFEKAVDAAVNQKKSHENEMHIEIKKVLNSFVSETEIDPADVFFYQNGSEVEIEDLVAKKGMITFEWGILVQHEDVDVQVSSTVNVEKKSFINSPDEVIFSIGEYNPFDDAMEKNTFMKILISDLLTKASKAAS